MTSPSNPSPAENPYAIDTSPEATARRAERRYAMADRLAVVGMRLVEEVVERAVNSPYHPEPRHDPARAYAQVSRAVRLTLVLAARFDEQIVAMRNGEPDRALFARQAARPKTQGDAVLRVIRRRVRDAVADAIDMETPDREDARRALNRLHENLIEKECYDRFLDLPFRECVAAICADLGVDPDWSRWSDEADFAQSVYDLPKKGRRDGGAAPIAEPSTAPADPIVRLEPG